MITSKAFYLIVLYYLDPHSKQDDSDPWLCMCRQLRDQSEPDLVRAHR